MRLVGNSYAVSIPREIVNFMNQQEKMMDEMLMWAKDQPNREVKKMDYEIEKNMYSFWK